MDLDLKALYEQKVPLFLVAEPYFIVDLEMDEVVGAATLVYFNILN